ncbi:MAG: hypothetical protein ACK5TN_23955 [Acidobacteriota bacterium]
MRHETSDMLKKTQAKKPCGCGGGGKEKTEQSCGCGGGCGCTAKTCDQSCDCDPDRCCALECVTRPNYFCGHLLTDADLRLEHGYFASKLGLHNRTLEGHGVVCGLTLSCEPDCEGYIRIAEGYGIDDCGRDLVVCSSLRYDLISELRRRGWILDGPKWDPCHPEKREPDCPDTQCFYIHLRYAESKDGFTTPLRGACNDGPAACEPTRIHETVCVEITREKPEADPFGLSASTESIHAVFESLDNSRYGRLLRDSIQQVSTVLSGKGLTFDACKLFCQLQYLFGLYLVAHPPRLRCGLAKEVSSIQCGREKPKDAFCELFELIHNYLMDEVLTAMLPACPGVNQTCGVVLGTVEVRSGSIVRLCHTPRRYVWTMRNAVQLLAQAYVAEAVENPDVPKSTCCPVYEFDCSDWQRVLETGHADYREWVSAPVTAAATLLSDYKQFFRMSKRNWAPASLLQNVKPANLEALVKAYQLRTTDREDHSGEAAILRPFTIQEGSEIALSKAMDGSVKARTSAPAAGSQVSAVFEKLILERDKEMAALQLELNQQRAASAQFQKQIDALARQVEEIRKGNA